MGAVPASLLKDTDFGQRSDADTGDTVYFDYEFVDMGYVLSGVSYTNPLEPDGG